MSLSALIRPTTRHAFLRRAPPAFRAPYSHLSRAAQTPRTNLVTPSQSPLLRHILLRTAASSVGSRPGSQTLGHARENIREEVSDAARDMAKAIAGGNFPVDAVKPTGETFLGVTSAVASSVPQPYMVMGLAGGLPYLGTAVTSVYLARQAGMAATGAIANIDPGVALTVLDQSLIFQATYGAVMLSFLGALHWGMEFSGFGGHKGYSRLVLGATPVVFAWSTLLLDPTAALLAQWGGFMAMWYADLKVTTAGWTPKWYSQYRFYLSLLVGSCIIATLASTSYWSPLGAGVMMHELEEVRAERKRLHPEAQGVVGGPIEAVPAAEDGGSFVILKKKHAEKEGEQQGEQQQSKE